MSQFSWMSEGYEAVENRAKELEESMNNEGYIPNFILQPNEEATIIFLTDAPINHYQHFLKSQKRYFTCNQTPDCPLCATGNKPSFVGAYLILDTRYEEWIDKKTNEKKTRQNTIKIMKHGIKALQVIQKQHAKRGLKNFAWEVTRTGSGTDTAYSFIPVPLDDVVNGIKLPTPEEIEQLKQQMIKQIEPKSPEYIADILAGRTPSTGGNTQQRSSFYTPNQNQNPFDVGGMEEDPGLLRFL